MQLLWRKAVHTHTCTVYSTQKDCYALQKTVLFLIRSVRNRETTMVSRKPLPPPKKKKNKEEHNAEQTHTRTTTRSTHMEIVDHCTTHATPLRDVYPLRVRFG